MKDLLHFSLWEILILVVVSSWFIWRLVRVLSRGAPKRVCNYQGCQQLLPRSAKFCPRCGHKVD